MNNPPAPNPKSKDMTPVRKTPGATVRRQRQPVVSVFELALLAEILIINPKADLDGAPTSPEQAVTSALEFVDAAQHALDSRKAIPKEVQTILKGVLSMNDALWQTHLEQFHGGKEHLSLILDGHKEGGQSYTLKEVLEKVVRGNDQTKRSRLERFAELRQFAEQHGFEFPAGGLPSFRRGRNIDLGDGEIVSIAPRQKREWSYRDRLTPRQARWIFEWSQKLIAHNRGSGRRQHSI